ncbi:MAG: HD domain-containing protein [Thermosphaera sp.]
MVTIGPGLLPELVNTSPLLRKAYEAVVSDPEVPVLWELSNIMAVKRLKYNDHGPVHAHIAAGAALSIFHLLIKKGITPSLIKDGVLNNVEHAMLVPLLAGLLHDIGNSVHRDMHERIGAVLAIPIVDRVLRHIIKDEREVLRLRQEVSHAIYCTSYDVECLTIEAGTVKVGDGLDMAEGRARVPYRLGSVSIHSVSALSIKKVEIEEGVQNPIRVNVYMTEMAGIFQVDEVLVPKIKTTPLRNLIEVHAIIGSEEVKSYP